MSIQNHARIELLLLSLRVRGSVAVADEAGGLAQQLQGVGYLGQTRVPSLKT